MKKQELLDRIDKMIEKQEDHIEWLKLQKHGKFRSFFFPSFNVMIDELIESGTKILNSLKESRIEYENHA